MYYREVQTSTTPPQSLRFDKPFLRSVIILAEQEWKQWDKTKRLIEKIDVQGFPLYPCIQGKGRLLNESICRQISPLFSTNPNPTLHTVYSSYEDGYCIMSLLLKAGSVHPSLLVIEVENNDLILFHRVDKWVNRSNSYGSMHSTLCKITNWNGRDRRETTVCMWKGRQVEGCPRVIYTRSTNDCILIGAAGRKGIALRLPDDFSQGYSEESDVFDSPPLQQTFFFKILNVELYNIL